MVQDPSLRTNVLFMPAKVGDVVVVVDVVVLAVDFDDEVSVSDKYIQTIVYILNILLNRIIML